MGKAIVSGGGRSSHGRAVMIPYLQRIADGRKVPPADSFSVVDLMVASGKSESAARDFARAEIKAGRLCGDKYKIGNRTEWRFWEPAQ